MLTLKIHHSGALKEEDGIVSYVESEVCFVDWVSRDYLSLLDLNYVDEKLGCNLPTNHCYKKNYQHNVELFIRITIDQVLLASLGIGRVCNVYFCVPIQPVQLKLVVMSTHLRSIKFHLMLSLLIMKMKFDKKMGPTCMMVKM